jgi:hypothetical protein
MTFDGIHLPFPPRNCSQKKEIGQHWKVKMKKKYTAYTWMAIRDVQRMRRWDFSTAIRSKKIPMLILRKMFAIT